MNDCPRPRTQSRRRCAFALSALIVGSLLQTTSVGARADPAPVRRVRAIQTRKVGISSPAGLAFSPRANAFVVLAGRGASFSDLRLIGPLREALGSARIAEVVTNPVNMAFDVKGNRLLILQSRGRRLVQIAAGSDGKLVPSRVTRVDLRHFGLQDPQGMTVDPATGHLFILDAALPRILRVEPGSSRAVPA